MTKPLKLWKGNSVHTKEKNSLRMWIARSNAKIIFTVMMVLSCIFKVHSCQHLTSSIIKERLYQLLLIYFHENIGIGTKIDEKFVLFQEKLYFVIYSGTLIN